MDKVILFLLIFFVAGCGNVPEKADIKLRESTFDNGIGKAFISFRIGVPLWHSETRFNELMGLFENNKGVTDEITFFTSGTHAPIPLDEFEARAKILKDRVEKARGLGYKAGINILTSIGHHEEDLGNSLKGSYAPMTNIDGETCCGSFCPNDENVKKYVEKIYQLTVGANPDYIWIDDDVRLGHMPIGYGCFCDHCLEIFEKETGKKYTRETLKKAFDEGDTIEKLAIRKAWLQHNRNTFARLFELIEKTVHAASPKMPLGFMTGDRFIEGYDFDNWAKILAGPDNTPVMWRPGGGYYNDENNTGLAGKSHDIGRQVSVLPTEVLSIESEIENFPYQRLKKAENIVVLEACSHIAAGCTGAAFNVLSMYDEPLDEYGPLVERLKDSRPFFDLLASTLGRSPITGIQSFWNKDSYATGNLDKGNWTSSGNPVVKHEFSDIGLPICYSNNGAVVTILGKDNIYATSEEKIKELLAGAVYIDAETLKELNQMGFGGLTGFKVVGSSKIDRIEKFTGNPLNGEFAGRERDNRQSFWKCTAYELEKTNDKAQVLSGLIDYTGEQVAPATMGIFENKLGGRICVAGYYPWTFMENLSKSSQAKAVFRWLSKDKLPAYVGSFHKINLWAREPSNGKIALAFTNCSFDPAKNLVLKLKTGNKTIKVYDMDCNETVINSSGPDGPYQTFVIPHVDPWQMRLVVSGQ